MTLTLTEPQREVIELLDRPFRPLEAAKLLRIDVGALDRRLQRAQEVNGGLTRGDLLRQFRDEAPERLQEERKKKRVQLKEERRRKR